MKAMLKQDIVRKATRLTRAGQLDVTIVLLRRMLRAESATLRPTGSIALTGRASPFRRGSGSTQPESAGPLRFG
jgi:hypothetical protein